jgi:hypothetical protein
MHEGVGVNWHTPAMARVLVILAAALIAAAPAGAARTTLTLVSRHPLAVRGVGFVPRERVAVNVGTHRVVVRATTLGRVLATFSDVDRCSAGTVIAVGARGDRAVLRLPPVMCAPAATP